MDILAKPDPPSQMFKLIYVTFSFGLLNIGIYMRIMCLFCSCLAKSCIKSCSLG